jgi:hypothetical protein
LKRFAPLLASIATAACAATALNAADSNRAPDPLFAGFVDPPVEARPLVFWQWVNGNVSKEGIRLDLEWMQRVGLGGALWFDIGFRTPPVPQYVEKRIGFGTPEWSDAIRFASSEAKRLGLSLGAQSGGGWSVSGGPQVSPEQAMKKLVWSETLLTRRSPKSSPLPMPPGVSGPYQDIAIEDAYRDPARYREVAVIAFREPGAETLSRPLEFADVPETAALVDGRFDRAVTLVPDEKGVVRLQARRATSPPRSLTIAVRGPAPTGFIHANDGRTTLEIIAELPVPGPHAAPVRTFALGERDELSWSVWFTGLTKPLEILEARFDTGARVNLAQDKAGYGVLENYGATETTPAAALAAIAPGDIVDLTAKMRPDGTLDWRPAGGRWIVQRFGWSLTGRRSVPATAESIGLEVDKLDRDAVRAFANAHYERFGDLDIALTDSWEAGQQNWTPGMPEEFSRRNGYGLRNWLPALTGRIIDNAARSERFLADFRRTISDLVVDNHYGVLAEVARERGLRYWAQAAGTDRPTLVDGMKAKSRVDVPMGEFWFYPEGAPPQPNYLNDVREAVSAAHVYGKPVVAAEGLATRGEDAWAMGPPQLRRIVDRFFAEGVNHLVLHTSAHQPFTASSGKGGPGMTLRQYGQHFTRNETWAEDAGDWVRYLSRNSWMLRQGWPVADIAIFVGDEGTPPPPDLIEALRRAGFASDWLNADALLSRVRADDGSLVRPDGGRYRALVIAPTVTRMSLPVLERLEKFASERVPVIGSRPVGGLGLHEDDSRARALADAIWNDANAPAPAEEVIEMLQRRGIQPDVVAPATLRWSHRAGVGEDIYFVANDSVEAVDAEVVFRIVGRRVEEWDAVTGTRARLAHSNSATTTRVRLRLEPRESGFIVFRGEAGAGFHGIAQPERRAFATVEGEWDVTFRDYPGGARTLRLRAGDSWSQHADPEIRFYSGHATYVRTIDVPPAALARGRTVELDLGTVGEIARVRVNGRDVGTWWSAPYRREITDALRGGENRLEIAVTNYWANRLIGDEQPGATPVTFSPIRPYTKDSPLRPSGLLGPVRLIGFE